LIIAKRLSDAQTKITCVRIYKARADPAVAAMAVDQDKFILAHFPGLLHNTGECPVKHDFSRMVAMKIDFHALSRSAPVKTGEV
jgi:hypothetical protein